MIFEREYLNGERTGKEKNIYIYGYNIYGYWIFEGEYLYTHKIKGKKYIDIPLIHTKYYEGEFLHEKK